MEMHNTNDQIRKARMVFWINLLLALLSLIVLVKTIMENSVYKIIAAAAGFLIFLSFAILVFLEINKLRKKTAAALKDE
jgi:hypothetical protein